MLEQFDPTIIKLAKFYHIPNMDWQDIAQELRLHLWLKLKTHNPRKFDDWAYIACKKKIIDLWRKQTHSRSSKNIQFISLDALKEKGLDISESSVVFNSRDG